MRQRCALRAAQLAVLLGTTFAFVIPAHDRMTGSRWRRNRSSGLAEIKRGPSPEPNRWSLTGVLGGPDLLCGCRRCRTVAFVVDAVCPHGLPSACACSNVWPENRSFRSRLDRWLRSYRRMSAVNVRNLETYSESLSARRSALRRTSDTGTGSRCRQNVRHHRFPIDVRSQSPTWFPHRR